MRKLHVLVVTAAMASATSLAVERTFNGSQSSDWFDRFNWTPNNSAPTIDDDVIIPSTFHVLISGENNAVAKSVSITGSGELEIKDGLTLQIRAQNGSAAPALVVNGELTVNEDCTLLLEDNLSGDDIARITGDGTVWGDTGTSIITGTTYAVDRVYVGEDIEILGDWNVRVSVENDGLFHADSGENILFGDLTSCMALDITGTGLFWASGSASVTFSDCYFDSGGPYAGYLLTDEGGVMEFGSCTSAAQDMGAVHITADDGGALFFYPGLETDGATISIGTNGTVAAGVYDPPNHLINGGLYFTDTTVTTTGGFLHSELGATLDNVTLTVGGLARFDDGFSAENGTDITIDDGYLVSSTEINLEGSSLSLVGDSVLECGDYLDADDSSISVANTSEFVCDSYLWGDDVSISVTDTSEFTVDWLWIKGIDETTVTIEDSAVFSVVGEFRTGDIVFSGEDIAVDVSDSATLTCEWFKFDECDLTIGGTFHVTGSTSAAEKSTAYESSIGVSAGTFKIGGGFAGNADLTLNGTLEVLASTNSEHEFKSTGYSQFLGGSIKVKQGEKVQLE